ncbi:hypothetical protein, partial [Roseovarius sp. D0-M9]|uniref:hypothetical protein n=1 Tax=Roseovarius sp. D0-M9 TaxID=3127117 RepID=UPI0030105753
RSIPNRASAADATENRLEIHAAGTTSFKPDLFSSLLELQAVQANGNQHRAERVGDTRMQSQDSTNSPHRPAAKSA